MTKLGSWGLECLSLYIHLLVDKPINISVHASNYQKGSFGWFGKYPIYDPGSSKCCIHRSDWVIERPVTVDLVQMMKPQFPGLENGRVGPQRGQGLLSHVFFVVGLEVGALAMTSTNTSSCSFHVRSKAHDSDLLTIYVISVVRFVKKRPPWLYILARLAFRRQWPQAVRSRS